MDALNEISSIYAGSLTIGASYLGSEQIWPANLTYEIVASSVRLYYSSGSTILASGSNYAYATGTVITRRGSTEIERGTKTLTPKTFGGTNPGRFYIPAGSPNTIKGSDLGTTPTSGYSATVTFVYLTSAETSALTITQQANTPGQWGSYGYYSFTSYSISAPATVAASAESFTVSGTLIYTSRRSRTWTSGAPEYQYAYNQSTSDNPTITAVQSTASARFEGNVVYINPNTGQSNITYNITASYIDPGGTLHTGYTASTVQSYVSYTYGDLSITEFTYAQIPASGNTGHPIYPKVSVTIPVYQGQTLVGSLTGTKVASDAANSMTVSGVGVSETVNLTFKVDGTTSTYGGVTAESLGTTPVSEPTGVAGCQVTATLSGTANKDTEYVTVLQEENVLGPEENPTDTTTSWYITITDSQGTEVSSLPKEGKTVYVVATEVYTHTATKHWTSGSPVYINNPGLERPIQASSLTNVKATYSGGTINATNYNQIAIPANSTTSTREFDFSASWSGSQATATESLNQTGVSYAYSDVSVSIEYEYIPASGTGGNKVFPTVRFTQTYGIAPATSGEGTINGIVNDGSTSGEVGGHQYTIEYSGTSGTGTYSSSDGSVKIGSKGSTRSGETTVASNCKAKVTMHSKNGTSSAFAVKQEANKPENISAIELRKSPTTAIPASGGTVEFTASCTFTWTSGSPGSFGTSDFNFSIQSYGNENNRSYAFDANNKNELTLGSLTSNYVSSAKTTTVRASNSDAGYADINITEAKNEYTTSLNVIWDFPNEPIPYGGGSTRAEVSSATLTYTYESGTPVPGTVSAYDILSNTSISGTGFSFSYSGGEYGTVTATYNSGSARIGTLTTTLNGATYVGSVQQSAYVPPVQYNQAYTIAWVGSAAMSLTYNSLNDTYVFNTGDSIISEKFSPLTSGAIGLSYAVEIKLLGDGTDEIVVMEGDGGTIPSSTSTRYNELSNSELGRSISAQHLEGYSYVTAKVSLVGVSSNLTMVGNTLSMRLLI